MMIVKQSAEWISQETEVLGENLLPVRLGLPQIHMTWPGLEPEPSGWVACNERPELGHGPGDDLRRLRSNSRWRIVVITSSLSLALTLYRRRGITPAQNLLDDKGRWKQEFYLRFSIVCISPRHILSVLSAVSSATPTHYRFFYTLLSRLSYLQNRDTTTKRRRGNYAASTRVYCASDKTQIRFLATLNIALRILNFALNEHQIRHLFLGFTQPLTEISAWNIKRNNVSEE
jgi:hypothetical protein